MSQINPPNGDLMPDFKWTIDNKDYQDARLYRASGKQWKRYYQGFNTNHHPENKMYKDELQDLEKVYRDALKSVDRDMRDFMPVLINVLGELFNMLRQDEALHEKLDTLLVKLGKKDADEQNDNGDRDD